MIRRISQFIPIVLILLSLTPTTAHVVGQTALVGVRIPAGARGDWQRSGAPGECVIDYGSFTWAGLTPADLAGLDAALVVFYEVSQQEEPR